MTDITVNELQTSKEELENSLEKAIKDTVDDFEAETGVEVSGITVTFGPAIASIGRSDGHRVDAEVNLNLPF